MQDFELRRDPESRRVFDLHTTELNVIGLEEQWDINAHESLRSNQSDVILFTTSDSAQCEEEEPP